MTLSKRYNAVMEKIEVTDAMRQRILASIGRLDLEATPQPKMIRFLSAKRFMPLAACFLLLLAGVFSARYLIPGETVDPLPTSGVMIVNEIVEVADAAALSETVGFPVKEVTSLPFQTDDVTYTSFWRELAQITYGGQRQTISLRQSVGNGDNSGDYTLYAETAVKEISGQNVTLKGDGQAYSLALWSDGTYAYSIKADPGLSISEWEAIISNM